MLCGNLFLYQLVSLAEQDEADGKHDDQRTHRQVFAPEGCTQQVDLHAAGDLADEGHQSGTHEGGTLAADVHNAVVFAAALGGDDLAQVGTAQSLDTALEHTHHYRQHPELPLTGEEHGKQGDAGVADDADLNQQAGVMTGGQSAEDNGAGEGHDLGYQQRQQQAGGIQTQGSAVGGGHVDDGVNTVDEEEKCQQVQENMLLLPDFFKGLASCRKV